MPRSRPPHLHLERTRHGKGVFYVRRGKGQRVRIRETFGSTEFDEAYLAALAGERPPTKPRADSGSLSWLIERYQDSTAWSRLSPATQSQRANIYKRVCETAGPNRFVDITKKVILAGRDRRKDTPFAANDFLKAMRALFKWALEADLIKTDPTDGVKGLGHKTIGFHTWSDDEIDRFEAHWPAGSRERLAFTILLYTGLRRGDAAMLGRQHVKNGIIAMRTMKTGAVVEIPILQELADVIAVSKTGDLAFIATEAGAPMTKESFGGWFKRACLSAGVPGTAHGLRKAGATRAANNGATEAELEAIFGWHGGRMASLYTRNANRSRLARGAIGKLSKGET